jgi:hypothetical protein
VRIYDPVPANEFWKRHDKSRAEANPQTRESSSQ